MMPAHNATLVVINRARVGQDTMKPTHGSLMVDGFPSNIMTSQETPGK
jgi:hypothetical protein